MKYLVDKDQPYVIMMLHAAVNRLLAHEMGGIKSEQLEPLRHVVDYLALGHVHSRYEIEEWGYNPGSLECVHLDEFGLGKEKGFYHVKIAESHQEVQYIPSVYRPVYRYYIDLANTRFAEDVYNVIINNMASKSPSAGAQVQVTLVGEVAYNPLSLDINSFTKKLKEEFSCLYVEIINNLNLPEAGNLEVGSLVKREDLERYVFAQLLLQERNWEQDKLNEVISVVQKLKDLVIAGEDEEEAIKMLIKYGEKLMDDAFSVAIEGDSKDEGEAV
jgi:DNA repair exonuclease SbcCD nuclease subunit